MLCSLLLTVHPTRPVGITALSVAASYITYIRSNNKNSAYIAAATSLCAIGAAVLYKVLLNKKHARQQARLEAQRQAGLQRAADEAAELEAFRQELAQDAIRRQEIARQAELRRQELIQDAARRQEVARLEWQRQEAIRIAEQRRAQSREVENILISIQHLLDPKFIGTDEYERAQIIQEQVTNALEALNSTAYGSENRYHEAFTIAQYMAEQLQQQTVVATPHEIVQAYQTLRSADHDTDKAIKQNYRKLVLNCHPDKHPEDQEAAQKFRALKEAFEVLAKHRPLLKQ
jgi:hypothetical protein